MQSRQVFVDTNVLVYAHDRDAGEKYHTAKDRILSLWESPLAPAISVQVLQELYVNLVRKGVSAKDARQTIDDYSTWNVIDNDLLLLKDGIELRERWDTSLWDGLILAAARRARAIEIWSEDFSESQSYEGMVVVNPFS